MTLVFGSLLAVGEVATRLGVDEVLAPYIYVFYASFIVAFLFTPIMQVVASYYGIVDKPDGLRKLHRAPVAYLGGVAVFLGWLAGLAFSQLLTVHQLAGGGGDLHTPRIPFAIAAAGIIIVAIGLIDDVRGLRPSIKISGQIAAALILISRGVGVKVATPLFGNINERLQIWFHATTIGVPNYIPEWLVHAMGMLFVVVFVVFCCNAANLMDGLDGLCGGVTAIIAVGYVFLAIHIATMDSVSSNGDAVRIILALALLGGVLGFVPFNFNPASIFMGDTGSMFLGFAVATMMLLMGEVGSKWLLAALVMFALPILDTSLAFVRRYVNGRHIFSADKHHIHHQFMARGLTVKQTVLFLYGSATCFVLLGATIAFLRTRYSVALYLVIFGSLIVAAYKMGMVHERVRSVDTPTPIGPDDKVSTEITGGVMEIRGKATVSGMPETSGNGEGKTVAGSHETSVRNEPTRML